MICSKQRRSVVENHHELFFFFIDVHVFFRAISIAYPAIQQHDSSSQLWLNNCAALSQQEGKRCPEPANISEP